MNNAVLYIHGKGGSAAESAHYVPLFPDCDVVGLTYAGETPWDVGTQIRAAVEELLEGHDGVTLVANSIGAFFSLHAWIDELLQQAFFISPIVDMERLITDLMRQAGISEAELEARGTIPTEGGEVLSWAYLRYVRKHPIRWNTPTEILYGGRDALTPYASVAAFAERRGAGLTVMEDGEHWFHTQAQMRFLDNWIRERRI